MGVIRVEHQSNYTVMSNAHLRDPRLSLRAMGLMSRMLSDSDSYRHSIAGLAAVCKEGRDAVRKALQELEAAGYLFREQTREGGNFSACDYILYEHSRIPFEEAEAPPLTEKPSTGNQSTDAPLTEKPSTGNPTTENPTQRNTKSKEITSKELPPIVPQTGDGEPGKKSGRHRATYKAAPDWEPEMFARFWAVYPKKGKKDKQTAIREWDELRPDRELMRTMSAALKRDIASEEWQRGIGVPYACRWLRRRRWEDDHEEPGAPLRREPLEEVKVKWL